MFKDRVLEKRLWLQESIAGMEQRIKEFDIARPILSQIVKALDTEITLRQILHFYKGQLLIIEDLEKYLKNKELEFLE